MTRSTGRLAALAFCALATSVAHAHPATPSDPPYAPSLSPSWSRAFARPPLAALDHAGLHFTHPLITESPSPDTKVRLDSLYHRGNEGGEGFDVYTQRLELEYAFHRAFSVELDVPYTFRDVEGESSVERLDNIELAFKFANFEFEDRGLLLGYGLELELPTGDENEGIGSNNELTYAPFLDLGWKRDALEVVAFTFFEIPTNQADAAAPDDSRSRPEEGGEDEFETELEFDLSLLYHLTPRVHGLLELDGSYVLSGEESGQNVLNLTPGIKFQPTADPRLELGFGVSFPLTDREEFETRFVVSAFYHL